MKYTIKMVDGSKYNINHNGDEKSINNIFENDSGEFKAGLIKLESINVYINPRNIVSIEQGKEIDYDPDDPLVYNL